MLHFLKSLKQFINAIEICYVLEANRLWEIVSVKCVFMTTWMYGSVYGYFMFALRSLSFFTENPVVLDAWNLLCLQSVINLWC